MAYKAIQLEVNTISAVDAAMTKQWKKFERYPLATDAQFIQILGEEFGEVCRGINQLDQTETIKEVVQCVAVCCAWLQGELHFGTQK